MIIIIQDGEKAETKAGVKLAYKPAFVSAFASDEYPMLLEWHSHSRRCRP